MRRFQHSLAPVPTVSGLGDALVSSDYEVEDGELIFVRSTRQVFAYEKPSTQVPDGVTVVASNFGGGNWVLVAGNGGAGFAGYFNTASAGAIGSGRLLDVPASFTGALADQAKVWVKSVRDAYTWYASRTDVADGLLVVNPTSNGANPGRFIRDQEFSVTWRSVTVWNVNPASGGDENDGTVSPLKTVQEIRRRTGSVFSSTNTSPVINILSAIPSGSTDTFIDDFEFDGDLGVCQLTWNGSRTQVATGVITAVQQPNPATGADRTVTSVGTNWTLYVVRGLQAVMTSGASSGSAFWVMKDEGLGIARISEPDALNVFHAPSAIATGNFRVDRLTEVGISVDLQAKSGFRLYQNLWFSGSVGCTNVSRSQSSFFDCSFAKGSMCSKLTVPALTSNCQWTDSFFWGGFVNLFGGVALLPAVGGFFEAEFGQYQLSGFECQGISFRATHGCHLRVFGLFGIWDSPTDGLLVGGIVEGETDSIYGTGNAGRGVRVMSLSGLSYANKPTVNAGLGLGRECEVGGVDKVWGDIPFVNTTNLSAVVASV